MAASNLNPPSTNGLIRLIYISRAGARLTAGEMISMVERAAAFNASRAISGVLFLHAGLVLQVLEGTAADVDALYARIEVDPRHYGCVLLSREPIEDRAFGAWSMRRLPSIGPGVDALRGFIADQAAATVGGSTAGAQALAALRVAAG